MGDITALARLIGRREALRCLGIGILGAASAAVLGGCDSDGDPSPETSVKARTLVAFVQGSWAISFPLDSERDGFTLRVDGGTWRVPEGPMSEPERGGSGTWQYAGGTLQVINWRGDDSQGTSTGVPEQVEQASVPASLPWTWKATAESSTDDLTLFLKWDRTTQTLTITAPDANGEPLVIEARKS